MRERRLYDFFNDKFEAKLPEAETMMEAYTLATEEIWNALQFIPYKNYESFIRLRKAKRKANKRKKITLNNFRIE